MNFWLFLEINIFNKNKMNSPNLFVVINHERCQKENKDVKFLYFNGN